MPYVDVHGRASGLPVVVLHVWWDREEYQCEYCPYRTESDSSFVAHTTDHHPHAVRGANYG